ncbi:hypothetical protein ABSA28_00457 [Candidatus Hepatincolaceae symbiont of Richtersius coronifer]
MQVNELEIIFNKFLAVKLKPLLSPKQLATKLANISKLLKIYLLEEIEIQDKAKRGELFQMYISFRNNLSESMGKLEFIDAFA